MDDRTMAELLYQLLKSKSEIRQAIMDKGVDVDLIDRLETFAEKILQIDTVEYRVPWNLSDVYDDVMSAIMFFMEPINIIEDTINLPQHISRTELNDISISMNFKIIDYEPVLNTDISTLSNKNIIDIHETNVSDQLFVNFESPNDRLLEFFMTSNTTPAPYVATASTVWYTHEPWRAFSGVTNQIAWSSNTDISPQWLCIDLGSPVLLSKYSVVTRFDMAGQDPYDFTFEGSNDDINWVILDTVIDRPTTTAGNKSNHTLNNNTISYQYYKLNITKMQSNVVSIGQLELYEKL